MAQKNGSQAILPGMEVWIWMSPMKAHLSKWGFDLEYSLTTCLLPTHSILFALQWFWYINYGNSVWIAFTLWKNEPGYLALPLEMCGKHIHHLSLCKTTAISNYSCMSLFLKLRGQETHKVVLSNMLRMSKLILLELALRRENAIWEMVH